MGGEGGEGSQGQGRGGVVPHLANHRGAHVPDPPGVDQPAVGGGPDPSARQQTLEEDGLTTTKRTSTVIGVGLNPAAEIKSIGVRENFTESVYAIRRRNSNMDPRTALGRANLRQASQANAMQQSASHAAEKARSEDVAMVAALK